MGLDGPPHLIHTLMDLRIDSRLARAYTGTWFKTCCGCGQCRDVDATVLVRPSWETRPNSRPRTATVHTAKGLAQSVHRAGAVEVANPRLAGGSMASRVSAAATSTSTPAQSRGSSTSTFRSWLHGLATG